MSRLFLVLLCGLAALAAPARADAQIDSGVAPSPDRFQLGPLGLQPRFRLTNVGIDTNVLNASANPTQDFTATFIPEVDSHLKIGRAKLIGKTTLAFVYFQKLADQRSADFGQDERVTFDLTRFTPYVGGRYLSSDQRPNLEIDARVHRTETSFALGMSTRLSPAVSLDVSGDQATFDFADVTFDGVLLSRVLDRTTTGVSAKVLVDLTPLTTFVVQTAASEDRFPTAPGRDSNNTEITAGFNLKRSALLSGTANVGVKRLQPQTAALQSFTGVVADVGLTYLFRDSTQITVKVNRGTDYSFELEQPYYVSTAAGINVTQVLAGQWDMVVRAGGVLFDYRSFITAGGVPAEPPRRDRLTSLGCGTGYRLTAGMRIGFDVSYDRRRSPVAERGFEGFRLGGSFIYGY